MKATDHFKQVIKSFLWQRAGQDPLFAPNLAKPNKSIDECITYILNEVQKSGCNGFTDNEIFSIAIDYYDEDNIEVGKPIDCKVIINHHVELTQEEKAQARKEAIKRIENETYLKVKQQKKVTKPTKENKLPTLFDF
ncbi:MAG: PcfK-like family protein [Phocaeicola sp.]